MSKSSPYIILDAVGWKVTKVDGNPTNGKIRYRKDDWELRVNWRPSQWFNSYLTSRRAVSSATPVTLLGETAEMWTYHRRDHTVISPVHGETFLEIRGEGMERATFLELLDQLRQVQPAEFDARLPVAIVRPHQIAATVAEVLSGIDTPERFDASAIEAPPYQEPYHFAAYVTGKVGCAWIDHYSAARARGDSASKERAVAAMRGSRRWPVLHEMQRSGDFPDEFWWVASDMASDKPPSELHGRICHHLDLPVG